MVTYRPGTEFCEAPHVQSYVSGDEDVVIVDRWGEQVRQAVGAGICDVTHLRRGYCDAAHMTGRADFALELQLQFTSKQAGSTEVKDAIDAALRHMNSGKSRGRRGGLTLIKLLEEARLRASEEAEWHVVRLIQDSIDYATGKILKPTFEEQYRIFQDGIRNDTNCDAISAVIAAGLKFAAAGQLFEERFGRPLYPDDPVLVTGEGDRPCRSVRINLLNQ